MIEVAAILAVASPAPAASIRMLAGLSIILMSSWKQDVQLGECESLPQLRVGIPSPTEDERSPHCPHIRSISHHPCDHRIGSLVELHQSATRLTSIQLHHSVY